MNIHLWMSEDTEVESIKLYFYTRPEVNTGTKQPIAVRYSTSIFTRIPPFEIKEDTIPQNRELVLHLATCWATPSPLTTFRTKTFVGCWKSARLDACEVP